MSTCTNLEVAICCNYKWKAEQTEKSTTLQGSFTEGKTQGKPLPLRWETEANRESHNLAEQRLKTWNHVRNQCLNRKTWTVIDRLLEAQHGQLWELKAPRKHSHRRALTVLWDSPPGARPMPSPIKYQSFPSFRELGRGAGEMSHF